jgi:L-fucose mutarotase
MLIGIHPALSPDVLHTIAAMGHGDCIVVVDANFPASSVAAETIIGKPLYMTLDAVAALDALLTHLPIDTFTPEVPPVQGMQIVGTPNGIPEVVENAAPLFAAHDQTVTLVERMAFYENAKKAFAVIRTTETLPYGNFLIRKGVVL